MKKYLVAICLYLLAPTIHAQTITKATITFHTTSDDKDGDTQVRDRITCNGEDFLKLECCSAGKNSKDDKWGDNSETSRDMSIVTPLTKAQLSGCSFVAGIASVGNDTWNAIYTLDLSLSDGSHMRYTLGEIHLEGRKSTPTERSIKLADLTPTFP